MMNGTTLIKLRPNGRQYHRYFTLSEDLTYITWEPTNKKIVKARLDVDSIREIRHGRSTDVQLDRTLHDPFTEDCAFSIMYGDNFESIDFLASSAVEANIWVVGLTALMGLQKDPLEEKEKMRERWLQKSFEVAVATVPESEDGTLDQQQVVTLVQRVSGRAFSSDHILQKLAEYDYVNNPGKRGQLDCRGFVEIYKEITARPDIYALMYKFARRDFFTAYDLLFFLAGEQGLKDVTLERCMELINNYETTEEGRNNKYLTVDGLARYLTSKECDVFAPSHAVLWQDMSKPITDYYISSCQNSFLSEGQLRGDTGVEGIIRALGSGCRSVRIDCWNTSLEQTASPENYEETKVLFQDCLEVFREFGFLSTPYPLFVHLQNHCDINEQRKLASAIRDVLRDALYVHPEDSQTDIGEMTLEDLRGKVVIMGHKLPPDCKEDVGEVHDELLDDDGAVIGGETHLLCRELSDLISLGSIQVKEPHSAVSSEVEVVTKTFTGNMTSTYLEPFLNEYKRYFTKIIFSDSKNVPQNNKPLDTWSSGCQMVALNYHGSGHLMDINDGRFRENGGCGYVLKPEIMRDHFTLYKSDMKDWIPGVKPQVLHIKIISAQHLPRPRRSSAKGDVIDPYVIVQVHGTPSDCALKRTKTLTNEGESPVFEESFTFYLALPEAALVRFIVLDDEFIGDDFIGQYTVPFTCLQPGYRHIRLMASNGELIPNALLFVHISVTYKRCFREGEKPTKNGCCGCRDKHFKLSVTKWPPGRAVKEMKKRARYARTLATILKFGIKNLDDIFKDVIPDMEDALRLRTEAEMAMDELRYECGVDETANMSHCLKVLLQRYEATPQITNVSITSQNGLQMVRVQGSDIPEFVDRSLVILEKALKSSQYILEHSDNLVAELERKLDVIQVDYEDFPQLAVSVGATGKRLNTFVEYFVVNVRRLKGQIDLLKTCKEDSQLFLTQISDAAAVMERLNIGKKQLHTSTNVSKVKINKNLSVEKQSSKLHSDSSIASTAQPSSSGSSSGEIKLKSILKRPTNNNQHESVDCEEAYFGNNVTTNSATGTWM
ncbi:inactive phospholipase C-like protein 2 [Schistocerca serialis cubense]|uniref:inactive phospholipase C-like protein 2 n=1 Tax=Schistocerca serialis cubense TaxID=2023355 RepID=UPI00214E9D3E|nr:inactive phospholipase C-like protein 2 [Schistocerca serialis cubense]